MKRKEHDFLGEIEIENAWYYGIQTVRNRQASDVTGWSLGEAATELLYSLASIKKAAALANSDVKRLDSSAARAIAQACDEIMTGTWQEHFPVDILTGGGGIGINMNMNEVLANRANELLTGEKGYTVVHPNTHVNMSQSTNDVIPAAMHLAIRGLLQKVHTETVALRQVFSAKALEHEHTVKAGRTCLQDALPVTLGQELGAHAAFLQRQEKYLVAVTEECLELPLGGTAVGTGVGTMPGYAPAVYRRLTELTGLPVRQQENLFDALSHADLYGRVSGCLKALSSGLSQIAGDLRLLSSGPRAGFGELRLPELLPGSSIMPGKINPVLPELMIQIHFQISGNDLAVNMAVDRGELDLNVWEAIIYKNIQESCQLLERGMRLFRCRCIEGIEANTDHCREQALRSTALAAPVAAVFGYEIGASVAQQALEQNRTIADIVTERRLLSAEDAQTLLDPGLLTSEERSHDMIARLQSTDGSTT